jgi:transposase InsO family protein
VETEWVMARIELYRVMREHPDWSLTRLAEAVGYSLSWVKKWRRRFREVGSATLSLFLSRSRAPHRRRSPVNPIVKEVVLDLRDNLKAVYHRVVGPKPILYHLQHDPLLQAQQTALPRSTHTLWKILKDGGRILTRTREHQPFPRPEPMSTWEFDFGVLNLGAERWLEFAVTVDEGTSILVDTQTTERYQADTALEAVARLFLGTGLPQRFRFDRDTRLVGSWTTDGYPSAFVRFLLCLGVEPVICPPRRPDLKPFVERCIRTLKHECLVEQRPTSVAQADQLLRHYRQFYNTKRAHQALSCQNRPPYEAFPHLPLLPQIPAMVDPDGWLHLYHGRLFRRRVAANGVVDVDKYPYYLGTAYAGQAVALRLDAPQRVFQVLQRGHLVKTLPLKGLLDEHLSFQAYLALMLEEARSLQQHLDMKRRLRRS